MRWLHRFARAIGRSRRRVENRGGRSYRRYLLDGRGTGNYLWAARVRCVLRIQGRGRSEGPGFMKAETFADKDRDAIVARLRRVEGQIRGLQRMVDEGRDCSEIVTQLSAARAALDRVGNVIVSSGLRGCL